MWCRKVDILIKERFSQLYRWKLFDSPLRHGRPLRACYTTYPASGISCEETERRPGVSWSATWKTPLKVNKSFANPRMWCRKVNILIKESFSQLWDSLHPWLQLLYRYIFPWDQQSFALFWIKAVTQQNRNTSCIAAPVGKFCWSALFSFPLFFFIYCRMRFLEKYEDITPSLTCLSTASCSTDFVFK